MDSQRDPTNTQSPVERTVGIRRPPPPCRFGSDVNGGLPGHRAPKLDPALKHEGAAPTIYVIAGALEGLMRIRTSSREQVDWAGSVLSSVAGMHIAIRVAIAEEFQPLLD